MLEQQLKAMLHEMETNPVFIKCQQKGLVKNTKNSVINPNAKVKLTESIKTVYTKLMEISEPMIVNHHPYVIVKQLLQDDLYLAYNINRKSIDIINFNDINGIGIQTLYEDSMLVEYVITDGVETLTKSQINDWYDDVKLHHKAGISTY